MYTALPISQMGLAIVPTYPNTDRITKHSFNYRLARYAEAMDPETPQTVRKFDSSLMWVKEEIQHREIIRLDEIMAQPEPSLGLEYYIQETLQVISLLSMEHEHLYLLNHLTNFLDTMVYRIEDELIKIHQSSVRGGQKVQCQKPVDLARLYLRPVKAAMHFHSGCARVFSDLSILPTVPQSEITNPGWVDSYTGEFEATDDMVTVSDTGITDVSVDRPEMDDCVVINGMTLTRQEFRQYLDAQKAGFDPVTEEEIFTDDYDTRELAEEEYRKLTKVEFDLVFEIKGQIGRSISQQKWALVKALVKQAVKELSDKRVEKMKKRLRAEHKFLGKAEFKKRCQAIYNRAKNSPQIEELRQKLIETYPGNTKELTAWIEQNMQAAVSKAKDEIQATTIAHEAFRESPMFEWLINAIQGAVKGNDPQNVLVAALKWQHEWCLWEEDFELINLQDGWTLGSWFEMNEDEILDQLNDRSPKHLEIDDRTADKFEAETVEKTIKAYSKCGYAGELPEWEPDSEFGKAVKELWSQAASQARKKRRKDLVGKHPAFNEAMLRAALNGASQPDQINIAWEAFREAVSPEGNKLYHEARTSGKNNVEAMKCFWRYAYSTKAIKPYIDGMNGKGVTLSNQRFITWTEAARMLKENELDITPDERQRIRKALDGRDFCAKFVELL